MASLNIPDSLRFTKFTDEQRFQKYLDNIISTGPSVRSWLYEQFEKDKKDWEKPSVTLRELTRKLVDYPYQKIVDVEKDNEKEMEKLNAESNKKDEDCRRLARKNDKLEEQIRLLKGMPIPQANDTPEHRRSATPPVQRVFASDKVALLGPQLPDSLPVNAPLELNEDDLAPYHVLDDGLSDISSREIGMESLDQIDASLHDEVLEVLTTMPVEMVAENRERNTPGNVDCVGNDETGCTIEVSGPVAAENERGKVETIIGKAETVHNDKTSPKELQSKGVKVKPVKQAAKQKTRARKSSSTKTRHKCSMGCAQDYAAKSSLSKHMAKAHKPHTKVCKLCGKTFALTDYLNKHMRVVHKSEK